MYRTIAVCIAAILLAVCLMGCGGSGGTSVTQDTVPAAAETKGSQITDTESGKEQAAQAWEREYGSFRPQNQMGCAYVETEQACYTLMDDRILFAPLGSTEFSLLCGRPDCDHKDNNCNAAGNYELGYYNGRLYTLDASSDPSVISMKPDGTDHRKLTELRFPVYANGQSGGAYIGEFINGFYYYFIVPSTEDQADPTAFRVNLETGDIEELWAGQLRQNLVFTQSISYSSGVLFCEVIETLEDGWAARVYRADPEENTFTPLLDTGSGWQVRGDAILHYLPGSGFYSYDMITGQDTLVHETSAEDSRWASYGRDYILQTIQEEGARSSRTVIYDMDYHVLGEIEMSADWFYLTQTEDRILFVEYTEILMGKRLQGNRICAYLELDELAAGNPVLHEIPRPLPPSVR